MFGFCFRSLAAILVSDFFCYINYKRKACFHVPASFSYFVLFSLCIVSALSNTG